MRERKALLQSMQGGGLASGRKGTWGDNESGKKYLKRDSGERCPPGIAPGASRRPVVAFWGGM